MNKPTFRFIKMHGLGNDIVIIDAMRVPVTLSPSAVTQLADRHVGIGFDQLIILKPGVQGQFYCQIFNADGSDAEQCGNGLRCIARYIHEEKLCLDSSFTIETAAGNFPLHIENYDHIRITMGKPQLKEKLIELILPPNGQTLKASILSLGNPHAIIKVDSIDSIILSDMGTKIANYLSYKEGINVGFMEIINTKQLKLKTYERGAGETQACGSNACAAVIAGILNNWLENIVRVDFTYGSLMIEWAGPKEPIHMTGPATRVFSGEATTNIVPAL